MLRMRPSLSTAPLRLLLFSFFLGCCSLCATAATSMPPSVAPSPSPSGFHPVDTVEEACHLMVEDSEVWLGRYPYCVAALRSNPESRNNATIHKLAVLAAEILLQDVLVELRRMQVMQARGVGGDPRELEECLSDYSMFINVLQGSMGNLRKDGRAGFQFFFVEIRTYIDCRWMKRNPVKKQLEILALLQALIGICVKYCRYPAPIPCRSW